ncbi:hypothetical protein [uncultured Jannaschia sp.]|uniref:hypothetical protein n=1 Tax=uncultured Jannaschia sp. TaxID=293347 RepID=UPI00260BDA01|nr:hypothetical protein [uncultured Jannaschia sp.]
MNHARMAPLMGLAMGGMIPLMIHGPMADAGIAFVAAHVAVVAGLASLAFVAPRVRTWLAAHRPDRRMLRRMALGVPVGFAVVCAHCLLTWHGSA